MFRRLLISIILLALVPTGWAQTKLPPQLAGLPDEIRNLKWQSIDMSAVQPLERCRALLLMNDTLDAVSANVTAEADLMSAYLEKNNLGNQFASTPPPKAPPVSRALSYADAEKISVALLRGPMHGSHYATDLSDLSASTLQSYQEIYARTCARRWSEFDESRHLVRCMSAFLGKTRKLEDYDSWAIAETARRELAAQQQREASGAKSAEAQRNAEAQKTEGQLRQQQLELMQMQAALAAAHAQQQQSPPPAPASQQQQAQQASGNQTQTPGGQSAVAMNGGYVVDDATSGYGVYDGYGFYGGYGGYGYDYGMSTAGAAAVGAYAGAAAANNANRNDSNRATPAPGAYHGANSTWNRQSTYNSDARAQTERRMAGFHGAGGRARR